MSYIAKRIETIQADGSGTNIAAALRLARLEAQQIDTRSRTILLISDGLSNEDDPIAASEKCREAGLTINTILIDPTSEGHAIATAISIGGWVRAAGSEEQAQAAMAEAAASYKAQPSAAPAESPFPKIVAIIGAFLGSCGTATAVASSSLDKPSLFPWAVGIILLALCPLLVYVVRARMVGPSLYVSTTEIRESTYPKYGKLQRISALIGMTILLTISFSMFRVGWEMRRVIQIRLANETDRVTYDVELVFFVPAASMPNDPELAFFNGQDSSYLAYFGSIKPHEATTYQHFNERDFRVPERYRSSQGAFVAIRSQFEPHHYFFVTPKADDKRIEWRAFLDRKYTCVMREDPKGKVITVEQQEPSPSLGSRPYGRLILACAQDGGY